MRTHVVCCIHVRQADLTLESLRWQAQSVAVRVHDLQKRLQYVRNERWRKGYDKDFRSTGLACLECHSSLVTGINTAVHHCRTSSCTSRLLQAIACDAKPHVRDSLLISSSTLYRPSHKNDRSLRDSVSHIASLPSFRLRTLTPMACGIVHRSTFVVTSRSALASPRQSMQNANNVTLDLACRFEAAVMAL